MRIYSAGEVLTCEVSPRSDLRRTALLLAARLVPRPEVGTMPCWTKAAVRTAIPAAASKLRKHCLSLCIGVAGLASGDNCWRGGERDFAIGLTTTGQPRQFLRLPSPLHSHRKDEYRYGFQVFLFVVPLCNSDFWQSSAIIKLYYILLCCMKLRSLLHRYQTFAVFTPNPTSAS